MTFDQMLEAVNKIGFKENREWSKNYCEVVISTEDVPYLQETLESFFGAPIKPEPVEPTPELKQASAPYGGIYRGQTMYARQEANITAELAMLWPWGDGLATTLKIVRI